MALKYVLLGLFALLFVPSLHAQIGPYPCGANSSLTTWRNDYAYPIGQVVILNGVTYQNLVDGNIDHNPCTFVGAMWSNVIAGTGSITSVFGRTGIITAQTGDYSCSMVTGCSPSPVTSVFTRTGTITAQTGDYTCSMVTGCITNAVASVFGRTGTITAASGDYTCAQVNGCFAGSGWENQLASSQQVADTTITLTGTVGIGAPFGIFFVDSEYETYTGINYGTNTLSGITRGAFGTTAAVHNAAALAVSVMLPFANTPIGGVFSGSHTVGINNGFPTSGQPLTINSGSNEMDVTTSGVISQMNNSAINYLSDIMVGVPQGHNDGSNFVVPITNTTYLVQDNAPHELAYPIGDSAGFAGTVASVPAPTIGAATLHNEFIGAGTCNITYEVTGVDVDGVEVPGTAVTISNLAPWTSPASVAIRYPLAGGVVRYNGYRTVVSAGCTGLATGKFASVTGNYGTITDFYTGGDSTTPPATNLSVAKLCTGSTTNNEQFCSISGSGTTPPIACSSATYGWKYHNVAATASPSDYICYSGTSSWAAISGGGGTTTNALTLNNSGSGASSGSAFNGSAPVTLSYNTIGAAPLASPTFTGVVTAPAISTASITGLTTPLSIAQGGTGATTAPVLYYADTYPSSCTVNGTTYTTRLDCAFYTLSYNQSLSGSHGATLILGNGIYTTAAGIVESNANPAPSISLIGQGIGGTGNGFGVVGYTSIQASADIPKSGTNPTGAVIAHAPIVGASISVPYGLQIKNLVVDPNNHADQAVYLTAEKVGSIEHVGILSANQTSTLAPIQIGDNATSQAIVIASVSGGAVSSLYVESGGQYTTSSTFGITSFTVPTGCPGSGATGTFTTNGSTVVSAAVTAGGSGYVGGACAPVVSIPAGTTVSGSGYQYHANDIFVENGTSTGPSSWAVVTQTETGGVPTFTVTSGGSYYFANPVAYWVGYGATTAPCTTMGTLVPTMSGTGPYSVTALTGYGFSGCAAGTAYNIIIADFPQAQYGWSVVGDTDATFKDIVVGSVGTQACIAALSGSDVYDHVHPIECNIGVYDIAQNKYIAPEYDSSFQYGHQLGVSAEVTVYGAEFQYAQAQPYTSGFYVPSSFTGDFTLYGNDCDHGASVTGFALVVNGGTGPVAHASNGIAYPGNIYAGMQCDTRAVVNYSSQLISGSNIVALQDSATVAGLTIGSGASATNFIGISSNRGAVGFDNTNGNAVVQGSSGKGIEFNESNTFGSGLVGKFDGSGNFGVGTNQTVTSDAFNVTAAGAAKAASVTDSALTSGDCTQAGTGGLLASTAYPCANAGVNAQVGTSYTVVAADANSLVTFTNAAAVAVTLPVATTTGFTAASKSFHFKNEGAGVVTITPTTSTIDGYTTLVLEPLQGAEVWSDGTNYHTSNHFPFAASPAPTCTTGTAAGSGATCSITAGSTNGSGQVLVTMGTGTTNNSTIVTITLANGGFKATKFCMLTPNNNQAASAGTVYLINSATAPTITSGSNTPSASQSYEWTWGCP